MSVTTATHICAAAAYLGLAAWILVSPGLHRRGLVLAGAAAASSLWAGLVATASLGWIPATWALPAETIRAAAWCGVLLMLVGSDWVEQRRAWAVLVLLAVADLVVTADIGPQIWAAKLGLAILGLVLVENAWRNARPDAAWSLKYAGLGLGIQFAFDVMLDADALLYRQIHAPLAAARGAVAVLAIPLIVLTAARNPGLSVALHSSRRAVFHTGAILCAGLFLLAAAAAGYYVRTFGGEIGPVLAVIIGAGAVTALLVALASHTVRSRFKQLIAENFFTHRYDYRIEWQRVIRTLSAHGDEPLHRRALRAIADVMDCPGAALWLRRDSDDRFLPAARWCLPGAVEPLAADDPVLARLSAADPVVDLSEHPDWLRRLPGAWIAVALVHRDRLIGCIALHRPRIARSLGWEDRGLLEVVARQLASYIAEDAATRALVDARRFDEFGKRFAFALHDVKSLVGQLSLLLRNAERHEGNPQFQRDLIETVRHTVAKMTALMEQMGAQRAPAPPHVVDLAELVARFVAEQRSVHPHVRLVAEVASMPVRLRDPTALAGVLQHLVENAIEASGAAPVDLRLWVDRNGRAGIDVRDRGGGMDEGFVQDMLFRPFASTKGAGFGIGAFQARDRIEAQGGTLDVITEPGRGTTMRIVFPLIEEAAA